MNLNDPILNEPFKKPKGTSDWQAEDNFGEAKEKAGLTGAAGLIVVLCVAIAAIMLTVKLGLVLFS